jgi:hypothetical protein
MWKHVYYNESISCIQHAYSFVTTQLNSIILIRLITVEDIKLLRSSFSNNELKYYTSFCTTNFRKSMTDYQYNKDSIYD